MRHRGAQLVNIATEQIHSSRCQAPHHTVQPSLREWASEWQLGGGERLGVAEIRNDFTWSFSRQQTFDSCLRRYYFRYYLFWEGWRRDASEAQQKSYFFSKMQSLPMLIGSGVHQTIEELLRSHQAGNPIADPVARLRQHLNDSWLASKQERWRQDGAKRCPPLFEHYYQIATPKQELERLRQMAIAAIDNFVGSDLYQRILAATPKQWLAIEELSVLRLRSVSAFVAPDFAFRDGNEVWVLDWKTGLPRDDLELQLLMYALFAHRQWQIPIDEIRAFDVFLGQTQQGVELREVIVDQERLSAAEDQVEAGAQAMIALLDDPAENAASMTNFPPTDEPRRCTYCFFQEICEERPAPLQAVAQA